MNNSQEKPIINMHYAYNNENDKGAAGNDNFFERTVTQGKSAHRYRELLPEHEYNNQVSLGSDEEAAHQPQQTSRKVTFYEPDSAAH